MIPLLHRATASASQYEDLLVVARALLDSGAGLSLISQRVVQQLELPKTSHPITISGVMGTKAGSVSHMVNVVLAPMKTRLSMEAIVVPKVTCELPLTGANHLKPGKIDVLLGVMFTKICFFLAPRKVHRMSLLP